jgi:cytosol alanyl aminopeptidase
MNDGARRRSSRRPSAVVAGSRIRPAIYRAAGKIRPVAIQPNSSPTTIRRARHQGVDGLRRLHCIAVGIVIATLAAASIADASAAARKKVTVAPPTPPVMQLGNAVKPLAYEAELTIVPTAERFAGHVVIHVELAKATDFFWMNATRLDIKSANVVVGNKTFVAKTVAGGHDFVGLRFATALPAGRAVITLDYDGVIDRTETAGIFKQQDGDNWYAFTQFEDTDARRAFPCFDEPGWKTPWHLSLIVPASNVAAANMPITSEEPYVAAPEPPLMRKGVPPSAPAVAMKRVRFAPTPPLPSYLIAFAVGPFDVVDGGRAGKKGTQLRYIVPKGRASEVAYAKEVTPKLLDALEDYFGQPYPFAKLDSVAIPITVGFGAMENVGLITYQMSLMASRPEQETERFRRNWASVAAHEMAHQWFGDLVTMAWWNDTWLNESFATWMSAKVVDRVFPVWQTRLSVDDRREEAIVIDRLASTRQVRQPVNTPDDLANAFDSITYQKGAAVLSMFEGAIGEERFRNGVRRYLYEHAQGSARAEDFFAAMTAEAGPENASTLSGFKGFIEQPGAPRLSVSLDCGLDGKSPPKLILTQSRYVPSRPIGDPAFNQRWTFPACFQFGRGGDFNELCTLIQDTRTVVPLPVGETCPAWVLSNRGGLGYFVSSMTAELNAQLVRTPLLPSEAIPALNDSSILTGSGEWPADLSLEFAARFANNRQVRVSQAAAELASEVRASWLDDAVDRDGFARYVQKNFATKARALGWTLKSSDREGDATLRQTLLPWVADLGNDAALQREALRLSREWLAAKAPLPPGASAALKTAARQAQGTQGRELLDAALDALTRSTGNDRETLLTTLGSFRDPALAEAAYEALFSEKSDVRDGLGAMQTGARFDEAATTQAIHYLHGHYDAVIRRLPENAGGGLPRLGARICEATAKSEFDATFADRASKVPGGSRNYAQATEDISICLAARQLQHATLKAYVAKQ